MLFLISRLKKEKQFSLKSEGESMLPILQPNDIVFFKKTNFARLKINDIVLVYKNKTGFTHRIIYKNRLHIITKGDNNLQSDGSVYPKQILARVYQIKRGGEIFHPDRLYLLQSTFYFQEIVRIKQSFEKNGIDFVFLKGLPLHLYYEGSHPRRIYADCDILVNKKFKKKVASILEKFHYKTSVPSHYKDFQKFIGKELQEITYFKYVNQLPVLFEIHFNVKIMARNLKIPFPSLKKDLNAITHEFLSHKQMVKIHQSKFPILGLNDLILYLLIHFFADGLSGIHKLLLIKSIVNSKNKSSLDWGKIMIQAKKYGMLRFIIPGIYFMKVYFHINTPLWILKKNYPNDFFYTMAILGALYGNIDIFNSRFVWQQRVRKAALIFFLYRDNALKKAFSLLQPQLLLHLFYFVFQSLKKQLKTDKKNS